MQKSANRRQLGFLGAMLLPALLVLLIWAGLTSSATQAAAAPLESMPVGEQAGTSPSEQVAEAWELARLSGVYDFRTELVQTTDPALSLTNAGREPEIQRIYIEGQVDQPAERMAMSLWQNSRASQPVEMYIEQGQTFGRVGDTEWQEVDNFGDMFAPAGDPLGFLAGASQIQYAGPRVLDFEGAELHYETFSFVFDGPAFGEHVRSYMEKSMLATGKLPPGVSVDMPETYAKMTGSGLIWLDQQGLPRRLDVELLMPPQADGDQVSAAIVSELNNFDPTRIAQWQVNGFADPATWLSLRLSPTSPAWQQIQSQLFLAAVLIAFGLFWVRFWRSPRLYASIALVMIASIVFTPLLQSSSVRAYSSEQRDSQAEHAAQQAEAEEQAAADSYLRTSSFDPHQNPLETPSVHALEQAVERTFASPVIFGTGAPEFQLQAASTITTTDSDDDGLSDADETLWRTCAFAGAPNFCDGVADPTDSDGDGLSDGDEVNRIGTLPTQVDTDGDSITDTVEIIGYTDSNGVEWYLDAYEADTNSDGLLDGIECPAWTSTAANPNPGSACPDTDSDGTPDIFDDDNDGDGVKDDVDTSPFTVATQVYNEDNPLGISLDGLKTDEPVFVNLQMRPTDPDNITYHGLVMDWPSGDNDGQIQRVLDTTWANTGDLDARSTANDAGYGDIRLVPFLEVSIPYSSGHYGNLPVKSSYQGSTRSLNDAVGDWLDSSVTAPYGISVQDLDATSGDLVAYVPLNLVSDSNGGSDVAFSAQMVYWPDQGSGGEADWGSTHSYRLVWFVQMLTDACPPGPGIPNVPGGCYDFMRIETMSIVQIYDDDWHLTGLDVVEERGMKVGIMYEDPDLDSDLDLDQQLWNASWLLGNTFLRGQDCPVLSGDLCDAGAQDGQRDVTIDNAIASLDDWAADAGDLSYMEMAVFNYEHEGFMAHIMMTETVALLGSEFDSYADQTVPTLLFLTEKTRRTFNLDDTSLTGSTFSVDFDPSGTANDVPLSVVAGMKWASYYDADDTNGVDWQSYDPYEYLEYLDWQLQSDSFFTAVGNDAEAIAEAEGKRLWAQIYYIALYTGSVSMVEINGVTAWTEDLDLPEPAQSSWPNGTFYGATFVAFSFLTAITSSIITSIKSGVNFWQQLKYAFSYNYSFYTGSVSRTLKSAGRTTLFLTGITIALIIAGAVVFAIGFFTNNEELLEVATVILNIATAVVLTAWLVNIVKTLVQIVRVASAATQSMRVFSTLVSGLAKSSRAIGVIGLVIAIGVTWGFFFASWISGDIKPGTVEFNLALALAIAQTIVIIVLFVLEIVFGIVLSIIIILIFIIDAILAIFGKTGIIDYITEWLAGEIYDVDYVIHNLDSPNRLDMNFTGVALEHPEMGFVVGNSVFITVEVITRLDTKGDSDGKRATFRYLLAENETDIASNYNQNTMRDEWTGSGNFIVATQYASNSSPIPLSAAGTGVNVDLNNHVWLNEGAIIPYEGCWRIPIYTDFGTYYINVDCTWYDTKTTNHINLGEYQVYDVLPSTIGGFVSLNWTTDFPAQHDYDNDGMLGTGMGGVDPNDSKADIDGDTLNDTYELTIGTNPLLADSDEDGISDADELKLRTNPLSADSDGDGLDDYTEAILGWLVIYDENNNLTRIWSDPNLSDADNDTLSDLEEFVFGFNPWTATDPSAINNIIQFDNININEAFAPLMHFEFEEPNGASIFNDDYGRGYSATCPAAGCPTSGTTGKFGSALEFDSAGDRVRIQNVNLTDSSFTIAGWVNRDNNNTVDPLVDLGGVSIIFASDKTIGCGYGAASAVSTNTFNRHEWHHFACVFDQEVGTLSLYVNGVLQVATPASAAVSLAGTLTLGYVQLSPFEFTLDGTLDEVGIYAGALDSGRINDVIGHRYVINDLLVAPGTELIYQATVSNTHPFQAADGLLTADTHYIDPIIGLPETVLGFEAEEKITSFPDSVGQSTTATCISDLTCPATGAAGKYASAIEFDGVDDYLVMPVVGKELGSYLLAFWFYPKEVPTSDTYILDTESEDPGALDVYLNSSGHLVFEIAGSSLSSILCRDLNSNTVTCPSASQAEMAFDFTGSNLNKWWFIGLRGSPTSGSVYINPDTNDESQLGYSVTATGSPINHALVGPGRLGNNFDEDGAFLGRIDDFIFYNQSVASPTSNNNPELSDKVYLGIYNFDYVGYSAKQINFLLRFDESSGFTGTSFPDITTPANNAYCESEATCPNLTSNGYSGYGLELDGVDDRARVDGQIYKTGTIDMTFYLYPYSLPGTNEIMYIFDSEGNNDGSLPDPDEDNPDWLDIYLDTDGVVYLTRADSTTWRTCFSVPCDHQIPTNTWSKVRIHIFNTTDSGNKVYAIQMWVNDVIARDTDYCSQGGGAVNCHDEKSRIGNGWIGGYPAGNTNLPNVPSGLTTIVPYHGILDELGIGVGIYPFDLAPLDVGFINTINKGISAHCDEFNGCPESVAGGPIGNAARFDGLDDFLRLDQSDFVKGDYSLSGWFKTGYSGGTQTIFAASDPGNNSKFGTLIELNSAGRVRWLDRFPTGNSGGTWLTSATGYNDNTWHHFLAVKSGTDMTLILDGTALHSAATSGYGDDHFDLHVGSDGSGDYFNGDLDEIIIIPSAVADGTFFYAAETLMNSHYPPIAIDQDFQTFDIPAQSATTAAGTAIIDTVVANSEHQFDQEVEAALQLQSTLSYPIIDSQEADLVFFLPFEEVPGETTFINFGENGLGTPEADFVCDEADGYCPIAGLRGKVGRALFFDGIDDQISLGSGSNVEVNTIAAWVYGDRGTIVKTNWYGGMELDFNRLRVWWTDQNSGIHDSVIFFDIPENQWVHLVGTYNESTGALKMYINGVPAGTTTITDNSLIDRRIRSIGANLDGSDPFHGFIDDLRAYDTVLSAAQVTTLYNESTPLLQFEFDEDENASVFKDKSINQLTAQPVPEICYRFELDSMTVNSLADSGSVVNFKLDSNRLAREIDVTAGTHELNASTLLCGPETLEVRTIFSGTATTLGSIGIGLTPGTYVSNFSASGNNIDLSYTLDAEPIYRVNPSPGTDGKIGNTALFDGEGFLTVNGASAVNSITSDLTIMLWMMPDDLNGRQRVLASARTNSVNGFGLGLDSDNLLFTTWGNEDFLADLTQIEANIWQHVAIVFDSAFDTRFYVDGVLQQTVFGTQAISANGDDVLMIGGTTVASSSNLQEMFSGQLDELQVFNRAMSGSEVFAFYLRELRWYRDRGSARIRIDADLPQVALLGDRYYANQEVDLVVSSVDVGSDVRFVDFQMQAPSDGSFSAWTGVQGCQGASAVWCLSFDPSVLDGEGIYLFNFRAYDAAGNVTVINETIYVDDTPPDVNTLYVGQWLPVDDDTVPLAWTLPLSGTVSDPMIGAAPGSGILVETESTTMTLQISLFDSNLILAGEGTVQAQVSAGSWAADYRFAGQPPHGLYSVDVSIADNVGNESASLIPAITASALRSLAPITPTLKLDARPPSIEMNLWFLTDTITSSITLSGTIIDAMDPGGASAQYHFEESSGVIFYDSSYQNNHALCASCPTLGQAGVFGQAVEFSGTGESILIPPVVDPVSDTFSAAAWVYLDDFAKPYTILAQQDGTGTGQTWLATDTSGQLYSMLGSSLITGTVPLNTGQWQHVALTYDGVTLRLYLDAALIAEATPSMQASDGALRVGVAGDGSSDPLDGLVDELIIFNRALTPSDVYAIAQAEVIGLESADIWLEVFPFTSTLGTPAWTPVNLQGSIGDELSAWNYALPNALEDYYRIHLQGTDLFNNTSSQQRVWRGIIDVVAPRLTLNLSYGGSGSAASTTYHFVIEDKFLDETTVAQPCEGLPGTLTYDYDPNTGLLVRISGECRVAGWDFGAVINLAACDLFQHCSGDSQSVVGEDPASAVLIREPAPDAIIGFDGSAIPIEIGASTLTSSIEDLSVSSQLGLIDTISYTTAISDVIWNANSWTPTTTGTYTLTAVMTDSLGAVRSDEILVHVVPFNCFADYNGDNVTDFASLDHRAAQDAIDAALPGAAIHLAGSCVGVSSTAGLTQTLYISKSLTLIGGYDSANWAAGSDPAANPTILDADNLGRVIYVESGTILTLQHLNVQNGAHSDGAGIYNAGTLDILASTLSANVGDTGGAVRNTGTLTIAQSTLMDNLASSGAGVFNTGSLVIENSTLAANQAASGSAVSNQAGADAELTHVTVSANTGSALHNLNTMILEASLLANGGSDCSGTLSDNGYNLSGDSSCGLSAGSSLSNTAVSLGALTNNGAATLTQLPQAFSPAIDAIPPGSCALANDQLGTARPFESGCDIGAIELTANFTPTAIADAYSTDEDDILTVPAAGVLTNDLDGDWDALSAMLDLDVISGTLDLHASGAFTYTPDLNICGSDEFSYHAQDQTAASNSITVTITIDCLPPSADIGGPYSVTEGGTVQLSAAGSLERTLPGLTYEWDYDYDGSFSVNATGPAPVLDATGMDGPSQPVLAVRVTDYSGLTDIATTTLQILNAAPVQPLTGTTPINEAGVFTLTFGTLIDPGLDTVSQCEVDWGDGISEDCLGAMGGLLTHVYTDGLTTPTIIVDLTDEDGLHAAAGTFALTVNNLDPAIQSLTAVGTVDEGTSVNIVIGASDPAGVWDPLLYEFDCDGSGGYEIGPQGANSASCLYPDQGVYTTTVRVTDGDGGQAISTTIATVANVAPMLIGPNVADEIDEGATVTYTAGLYDPSPTDVFTLTIQWGDGNVDIIPLPAGTTHITETHVYEDDNPSGTASDNYSILVQVADGDLGTDSWTGDIDVDNVAPQFSDLNATAIGEGGTTTLSGSLIEPGLTDALTVTISWGDGVSETYSYAAGTTSFSETHLYDDDTLARLALLAVFNIDLDVVDDDLGSSSDSVPLDVNNVAPTLILSGDGSIVEGSQYTLTIGSVVDPGDDTVSACTLNWGDGASEDCMGLLNSSQTHAFPDGPQTISITVDLTDEDGFYPGAALLVLNVQNADPEIIGVGLTPVLIEGEQATLTGSFTDPGVQDTFTLTVDWGDGTLDQYPYPAGTQSFTQTHTYLDDSPSGTSQDTYAVSVTITDKDGGSDTVLPEVTVFNEAPDFSAVQATDIDENSATVLSGLITDIGVLDTFTVTIDWGDGSMAHISYPAGTSAFSETHVYLDGQLPPEDILVLLTVTDDDGGFDVAGAAVRVFNVAPIFADLQLTSPISEGQTAELVGQIVDPSPSDTFTLTVDWDDGQVDVIQLPAGTMVFTATHAYPDDDPTATPMDLYAIDLDIVDDDGGSDSTVLGLTVKNAAPLLTGVSAPVINEGLTASIAGTISDPGVNDTITVTIDWGDGSVETFNYPAGTTAFDETHAYPDDNPTATSSDVYLIGLTATDDDSGLAIANTTVTVNNLAPLVDAGPAAMTVMQSTSIDFSGWFTDAGVLDSHQISWDFGDGGMSTGDLNAQYTFLLSGTFTVTLTVIDDDTGVGQDTILVTVTPNYPVYLPLVAGGMATGSLADPDQVAFAAGLDEAPLGAALTGLLLGGVWLGHRRRLAHGFSGPDRASTRSTRF